MLLCLVILSVSGMNIGIILGIKKPLESVRGSLARRFGWGNSPARTDHNGRLKNSFIATVTGGNLSPVYQTGGLF